MFYVPECSEFQRLKDLIEANGGLVVEQHECSTFQIKPKIQNREAGLKMRDFYQGQLVSEDWITEFVREHKRSDDPMMAGGRKLLSRKQDYHL